MTKGRKLFVLLLVLTIALTGVFAQAQQEATGAWKPTKTISLIIPWDAGGASDQTARIVAGMMEGILGSRIAVLNQPGASGATGQKTAYDAPKDGYTWAGNADASVATYQIQNLTPDISHRDWRAYFAVFTPCVITVNPDSPIKDWDSLVNAFKTRLVKVSSAGIGAGGHIASETFAKELGVKYTHVPYPGGNPAVVATVSGETEVVMQLSMEVADMLRAGKLRAIAVLDDKPLNISGVAEIPSINKFLPSFPSVGFHFGLFIPRGIPENVADTIADAFVKAANSDTVKEFALGKGALQVAIHGAEADAIMEKSAAMFGYLMYEGGVAPNNPADYGLVKP